jgi:hypothetical protein
MGRVLSPALWQHAVRKEEQKVVPLSLLAEERGGGGGATQPHQQAAEELQTTYSYSYRRVGQIITVFRFEHFPSPLRLFCDSHSSGSSCSTICRHFKEGCIFSVKFFSF